MSPILKGVVASQITGRLTTSSFDSIATVTVGAGGSSSVSFSSIPSTYTHLQLRIFGQTNRGTYGIDEAGVRFNSDTGSNYASHILFGDGGTAQISYEVSSARIQAGSGCLGTTTGTGTFGINIIDIMDYKSTNKYKILKCVGGVDVNGTVGSLGGRLGISSGLWMNTSAISSINIYPLNSSLFTQYSSFALYGIKGA